MLKKIIKGVLPYGLLGLYKKMNLKHFKMIYGKSVYSLHNKKFVDSPQFIITLTSFGKRVNGKAPYAVRSLLNQNVQPDRIVLWLAHGTNVPRKLKRLENAGLEVRFCDDIGPYTKLIPALSEFPDDILVTADDDVYYPPNWFKMLKETYLQNPRKICCHRAHEIRFDENKNITPYKQWQNSVKTIEHSKRLFPTGVGGILYPPHSFNKEIFDASKFQTLAPTADDIWFWAMARHNGKDYVLVKNAITALVRIGIHDDGLEKININEKKNDEQIKNVIEAYPDIYESIV